MLNLESFVHREKLVDIIGRWMVDQPEPSDVRELKRVINFNSWVTRYWGAQLTLELLRSLHGAEPRNFIARRKRVVKDFSVENPTYTNARIEQMIARYRRFPEDFYRETPIDGSCYVVDVGDASHLVGAMRIKRFRRIAEKGSRRIVDFILSRIRANADALAEERARGLGIPRSQLVTAPAAMVEEFRHAERRVIKSIKQGTIRSELSTLPIPDVVGIKLIVEDEDFPRVLEVIHRTGACRLLEAERHSGEYNAINLRVSYRFPREILLSNPPSGPFLETLAFRGFSPQAISDEYRRFVEEAEDEVFVEIIVSSFQEYLESEIGRCMHEERILSQRAHPDYTGHLATNVRYLMNYILDLCRAPGSEPIHDVPIKLWVKYMPDTIEDMTRMLYLSDELFFDTMPELTVTNERLEGSVA